MSFNISTEHFKTISERQTEQTDCTEWLYWMTELNDWFDWLTDWLYWMTETHVWRPSRQRGSKLDRTDTEWHTDMSDCIGPSHRSVWVQKSLAASFNRSISGDFSLSTYFLFSISSISKVMLFHQLMHFRTEGLRDRGTEGLRDQGTEGPRDWGMEWLNDWGTEGLMDSGAEGLRDWGAEGLRNWRT